MNLSFLSRRDYASNLAGQFGLAYKEDPSCKVPHATATTIVVPPYQYSFTEEEDTKWWKSFIHECYHHHHPEDFEFLKSKKITSQNLLTFINNLVCDHKIEFIEYGHFPGRDKVMDEAHVLFAKDFFPKKCKEADSPMLKKLMAAFAYDTLIRSQWCRSLSSIDPTREMPADIKEMLDRLVAASIGNEYVTADTPEKVWEVAKKIVNILEDDEEAADKQEEEASSGSGDKSDSEDGEGEGTPESGEEGEAAEGEGEEAEIKKVKVFFDDLDFTEHDDKAKTEGEVTIEYGEDYRKDPYKVRTYDVVHAKDMEPDYRSGNWAARIRSCAEGEQLSEKIRKNLLALKRDRYSPGSRRGKIAKGRVWKATVQAGTTEALKIRKSREQRVSLDVAVTVLLDQSGSMHNEKYVHGGRSLVLLNEVFGRIGVPVELLAFTDTRKPLNIIHKAFDQRISEQELVENLGKASSIMSGNSDGESIMWAYERLIKRPEKKKLLIVLSDGQPAGSGGYGIDGFTAEVIEQIEKKIDVYGIGINSRSVERYYRHHAVIRNPSDLEGALLGVINQKVLDK